MVGIFLCKNWKERIERRFRMTNADRIRNMSDYDLGDLLQSVSSSAGNGNPFISLCVDDNEITMNFSDIYEWLQSEAESKLKELRGDEQWAKD